MFLGWRRGGLEVALFLKLVYVHLLVVYDLIHGSSALEPILEIEEP